MASNANQDKPRSFFQTDLAKMGGTALVTAALFLAYNIFSSSPVSANEAGATLLGSGRISLAEAVTLRQNWLDTPLIKTNSGDKGVALQAFTFKADQLDTIINYNASLDSGRKADDIIFYFGRNGDTSTGSGPEKRTYAIMHLIAIGIKNDTLLITDNRSKPMQAKAFVPSVYDKADPCPPNCPKAKW